MKDPFRSPEDYELYLYSLRELYPSIKHSTVIMVRRGSSLARVTGELVFDGTIRLVMRERLVLDRRPIALDWYGYEVWHGTGKLYWYDSQPHPHDPHLQETHPHHKHVPPNPKHNRVPAVGLAFEQPNVQFLIQEIEELIAIMFSNGSYD